MSRLPRHLFQLSAALAVSGIAALWLAPAASAHVRWFVDSDHYPPEWDRLIAWPTLMVVGLTLGLLGTLLTGQRMLGQHFPNPAFLAYMEPSATTLLAVHTGISLVFFASQRDLFDASHALDGRVIVAVFVILQVVAAFALITGLVDRGGAALLAGTWLLAFIAFKPWQVLDLTLYVGIGIALFVLGRTIPPPAVAARLLPLENFERQSIAALRILAGFTVAWIAFTEKLLVPEAGVAFLSERPEFNFMQHYFGFDWWSDYRFTIAAGVVEASAGLLLLSGVLTRVVILTLLVPFNVTVAFLPPIELLGHLPIFGIMYVLLLYGSGADPQAGERRLEPALVGTDPGATATALDMATPDVDRPARE